MAIELKQHFVAFLDVLGFSEMVQSENEEHGQEYLAKLFRCHQSAAKVFRDEPACAVLQFSDSIVISMPYDATRFEWYATKVGDYQRLLLDEELLCRGGIAVNKHYSNGSFTFSAALIAAYTVESKTARFPRVVVSPDALDLVYPKKGTHPKFLIQEDDGLFFIDYLGLTAGVRPKRLATAINNVVAQLTNSTSPSVREKGLWLAAYSDAVLGTTLGTPKFRGRRVR